MSSFTRPLEFVSTGRWKDGRRLVKTTRPLTYAFGHKASRLWVTVPAGFVTDLATVPRWAWWFVAPDGKHAAAAVLHDWLCESQMVSRLVADVVFCEALAALGVGRFRRAVMFIAVRCRALRRKPRHPITEGPPSDV